MGKIQGITKLGKGKYQVTVVRTHPNDLKDGKPRKVKRKQIVYGSQQDAKAAHEELAAELEAELGLRTAPIQMIVTDYVQQWIELRAKRLKNSTLQKYMNDLNKHILPKLGHRLLNELVPSDIRALLAQDDGADNSRKNRLRVLSAISKDALADGLIDRDFCLRVSVKVKPVYTEEEPNLLTPEQLGALLEHMNPESLDMLYLLAFTGMRWCEVAGLKWDDIDLTSGVLRIKRANVKGHINEPKTQASRRTVGLPDEVLDRLRARRHRMIVEQHPGLALGWVFPCKMGTHHRGYPLRTKLAKARDAAGIQIRFTTHGLRRTYNDLARRHADGLVVRSVIGHSSEAMTEHYSHVDVGEKKAASEAVLRSVRAIGSGASNGQKPAERPQEVTLEVTLGPKNEGPKS